jgi:hypothetical protein
VIKNIAYFPLQAARNSPPVLEAFLAGARRRGISAEENSWTADAAVIWSVLWYGRMRPNLEVYNHYRSQNKPVIIIEVGALYRGSTWKIAVNNITTAGYYGHETDLDLDRPRKLGVSLADLHYPEPHIIIAAQHHASLQVADISSMEQWVLDKIQQIKSVTERPIVVRPHPRSPLQLSSLPENVTVQLPQHVAGTYDGFDMHYNCHAVVNHNSGPGVQAAIGGVRPIVDSSSLASPVSMSVQDIELPYDVDRDRWLIEICHTEYTLEEMRQGRTFDRLASIL